MINGYLCRCAVEFYPCGPPQHKTQRPAAQTVGVRDLKRGMEIKATVVTDEEHAVIERPFLLTMITG